MKNKTLILLALIAVGSTYLFGQSWSIWTRTPNPTLIEKEIRGGKLYLGWRTEEAQQMKYPEGGGPPNIIRAWREIYCVSNGAVAFERREDGAVTPASTKTETTPEKIEWPTQPTL